jgi:hypothetical protein
VDRRDNPAPLFPGSGKAGRHEAIAGPASRRHPAGNRPPPVPKAQHRKGEQVKRPAAQGLNWQKIAELAISLTIAVAKLIAAIRNLQ